MEYHYYQARRFFWKHAHRAAGTLGLASLCLLAGCDRSPTYSIFGSYFPAWLFCTFLGGVLAFAVYLILVRLELNQQLSPPILIYPALSATFSLSLWLLFFS